MKKLLSISFALLLLVSTIGVTVHKHYCQSALVTTSILPHGDNDSCDADIPMGDNSCEDQHQNYSVDSPLVLALINFDLTPSVEWTKVFQAKLTASLSESSITANLFADLSPPSSEPNIYTKVQSFLL